MWGFNTPKMVHESYNHALGQVVTGRKDERDKLKELSERRSEETGIPHNYQPVDLSDTKTLGITDEGLDTTYNARVKSGEADSPKRLIL